jgi:hypothetical protein
MLKYKLGKAPRRPGAISLDFRDIFNITKLPSLPTTGWGTQPSTNDYGMLGNDQYGDCVLAGACHESIILNTEAGNPVPSFSMENALTAYTAITGFNASNPASDQGTDVQAAAAYRQKTGLADASGNFHKVVAYLAVNSDDLALAAYTLGAAGWGLNVPASAENQFDAVTPWTFIPGDYLEGGHYVPVVGMTPSGNLVVITWGRTQEVTIPFYNAYFSEGIGYLSQEFLNNSTHLSPEQFNLAELNSFLTQVGAMPATANAGARSTAGVKKP